MKTVFDQLVREELHRRILSISDHSQPLWGKMNAYQMMKHNSHWNRWILGKGDFVYQQDWLGKIFGKMALKSTVKNDNPMKKGMPAGKGFTVTEKTGDFQAHQKLWAQLILEYEHFDNDEFIHDFFGKMTREEIGIFAYKHSDHHLRQFGF